MSDISGVGKGDPIQPSGENISSPFQKVAKKTKDTTREILKNAPKMPGGFPHQVSTNPKAIDYLNKKLKR